MRKSLKLFLNIVLTLVAATALAMGSAVAFYAPQHNYSDIEIDNGNAVYSAQTAIRFNASMAPLFGTGNNLLYFDQIDVLVDNIYKAFSLAAISEEKLSNILDEVDKMGLTDSSESPILGFLTDLISSTQNAANESTADDLISKQRLIAAFSGSLSFLDRVGMTPDETGRVLYHLALLYADNDRKVLLERLGAESFTMLTVGTYAVYSAAETAESKSASIATARMLGQSLTALGLAYRRSLDTIGPEGIGSLLGLDYTINPNNPAIDSVFAEEYNSLLEQLFPAAGDFLIFSSNILTRLDPVQFEELYLASVRSKRGDDAEAALHITWAMLSFARSAKVGMSATISQSGSFSTPRELIEYFAAKYSHLQLLLDSVEGSAATTFAAYYQDTLPQLEHYLMLLDQLDAASSSFSDYVGLKAYAAENPADYYCLRDAALELNSTDFNLTEITTELLSGISKAALLRVFVGLATP